MYIYVKDSNDHYAGNLSSRSENEGKVLRWDSSNCGIILIRSNYKNDEKNNIENICKKMNKDDIFFANDFYEVESGIFVKTISKVENANRSAIVNGAGRYYVYACEEKNGDYYIYPPPSGGMGSHYTDVRLILRVSYEIEMKTVKEGFLKNKINRVSSGYYSVLFQPEFDISHYNNGDIYYYIGDIKIPITKNMLQLERIFIKTDNKPEMQSDNLVVMEV